jgi:ubiquitin carboxyl-terminal hydrolase MINDY-3/4
MEQEGWGIVLLLASVLLTHGPATIESEMDDPSTGLSAVHGYCTQELVNLLLTGQAVSNVFDGCRSLDGGTDLRGVGKRSRLGLLTLFEWYKYVEVGTFLKEPEVPVWVVCSESHFTVLFGVDQRAAAGRLPFDLVYYDGLANQEGRVVLSVRESAAGGWTRRVGESAGDRGRWNGENIPPLECVIETKWPGVEVHWNGTDPIL